MFATPSWLGSFITSRSNEDINEFNRKHELIMEDIRHKHEYLIQESRNKTTEDVAKANRESTEEIAKLNREHEATIADAKNKNAISVALIQAASHATEKALPFVFPAIMAGKYSGKQNNNRNDSGGNATRANSGVSVERTTNQNTARQQADNLFPELEPTFGVSLTPTVSTLPKINVTNLVPALGAVLSVAAPILAIL